MTSPVQLRTLTSNKDNRIYTLSEVPTEYNKKSFQLESKVNFETLPQEIKDRYISRGFNDCTTVWEADKIYRPNGDIYRQSHGHISEIPPRSTGRFTIIENAGELSDFVHNHLNFSGEINKGKITKLDIGDTFRFTKDCSGHLEPQMRRIAQENLSCILEDINSGKIQVANITKVYLKKAIEFLLSHNAIR